GSEFQRLDISTREVKTFSMRTISPRIPEVTRAFARTTSCTKRNLDAIVILTPVFREVSIILWALGTSMLSGFSHSTATPRSRDSTQISACVFGGVQIS